MGITRISQFYLRIQTLRGLLPRKASDELVEATRASIVKGDVSLQTDARKWFRGLDERLQDEVILIGLRASISIWSYSPSSGTSTELSTIRSRTDKSAASSAKANAEKKAALAFVRRLVEMLDQRIVGDKKLGDCTRADLLREVHRIETEIGELTADAALYRTLAGMIGNKTVREYDDRAGVIGLLTHRWGDDTTVAT